MRISFAELNFRMNQHLLRTTTARKKFINTRTGYLISSLFVLLLLSGCASTHLTSQPSSPGSEKASALRQPTPLGALSSLKVGNERFISGKVRTDGQSLKDIQRLSTGQAPEAIVLSCSDSRVPPEIVFDQKLGEMFTVRSAGEALSSQAIASIEFAIAKLGSKLIVVMGHTSCGAVKAAVDTLGGASAGSENLDQLVKDIKPRLRSETAGKIRSQDLAEESLANAKGVARDLMVRSKIISAAVNSGKVKIAVALYNLSDGRVTFE